MLPTILSDSNRYCSEDQICGLKQEIRCRNRSFSMLQRLRFAITLGIALAKSGT